MKNIKAILEQYKKAATIYGIATQKGDHKTVNKQATILKLIYEKLKNNPDIQRVVLNELIQDKNLTIRSWAAAHCLGLKIKTEQAEQILENISKRKDVGIISFDAETTLSLYKKQGYLNF